MRFSTLVLFSVATIASAKAIDGLITRTSSSVTASQICGCFSGELHLGGRFGSVGSIDLICLCEGDIPNFVAGNSVCQKGTQLVGFAIVEPLILGMLLGSDNHRSCTHPDHTTPSCSSKNICGYKCKENYSPVTEHGQTTCKCDYTICGSGKCQKSCPSAYSLPEKRDLAYWGKRTQRICKQGWKACGVLGGGPKAWECVDILNDLESCGDCPFDTMVSANGTPGLGVDCSALPGVSDVACVSGRCAVDRCMPGYKVSANGQHCEVDETDFYDSKLEKAIHFLEDAAAYGFQHIPSLS